MHLEVGPDGRSYDVTGRGCSAGWKGLFDPALDVARQCGDLRGHGAGLVLEFTFYSPEWSATYAVHAQASKDGSRMESTLIVVQSRYDTGGPYPYGQKVYGFLRLADIRVRGDLDEATWPPEDRGPFTAIADYSFLVALRGDAAVGALVPGQRYFESLDTWVPVRFSGDLGAFWDPDLHWDEATRTYTAGPVPETIPGMPVKLELHLNASDVGLRDIVATMADGSQGTLVPVPPDP